MRNAGNCLSTLIFVAIFGAVGLGLSIWGWTILQDARASANWPDTPGRVLSSQVSHSSDSEGGDSYQPQVQYAYVVDDRTFQDDTIKFGENSYGSRRTAEEIAGRYPPGATVPVYYDPAEPQTAVLEPGVTAGSYLILGLGVCFGGLAVVLAPVLLLFGRRRR